MQNQCRQVLLLLLFYERVISILLENYFHLIIYRLPPLGIVASVFLRCNFYLITMLFL